jgi:hypothetical protein
MWSGTCTDNAGEPAAATCRVIDRTLRRRQQVCLKRRYTSTRLHGVTSQEPWVCNFRRCFVSVWLHIMPSPSESRHSLMGSTCLGSSHVIILCFPHV